MTPSAHRWSWLGLGALLAALVLLVYWPALGGDFFADDFVYVSANERLQQASLGRFWEVFTRPLIELEFYPLRDLSYLVDLRLFGDGPLGFKLVNLVLYAACVIVSGMLAEALAISFRAAAPGASARRFGFAVALLFLAHPAHVESVAWISGRKELLSGFFALLSLLAFVRHLDAPGRRLLSLLLATLSLAAAVLSKSVVVAIAPIYPLLAVAVNGVRLRPVAMRSVLLGSLPLLLVCVAAVLLHREVGIGSGIAVDWTAADGGPGDALHRSLLILGYLVGIAALPWDMRLIYDVYQPGWPMWLALTAGAAAVVALAVGLWAAARRSSLAGLGVVFFVVLCLPFLQWIPFGTWSLASERFLFLPLFGLLLALVAGLHYRFPVAGSRLVLALALPALLLSWQRAAEWGENETLIVAAARSAPQHPFAQEKLVADVLLPRRDFAAARQAVAAVRGPAGRLLSHRIELTIAGMRGDANAMRAAIVAAVPDYVTVLSAYVERAEFERLAAEAERLGLRREAQRVRIHLASVPRGSGY